MLRSRLSTMLSQLLCPRRCPHGCLGVALQAGPHHSRATRVFATATLPKVGVGIVALRHLNDLANAEVLLITRGQEPSKGKLCFPGGKLELGETLAACAVREVQEETGVRLRCLSVPQKVYTGVTPWQCPVPLTVVDGITRGKDGSIAFHYAIIEMLATVEDEQQAVVAADDADDAAWHRVDAVQGAADLETGVHEVLMRAMDYMKSTPQP